MINSASPRPSGNEKQQSSLPSIAASFVVEAAWVYLVLSFVTAATRLSVGFSPAAMVGPMGGALVATPFVAWLRGSGRNLAALVSRSNESSRGARGSGLAWLRFAVDTVAVASAVVIYLLLAATFILGTLWWELYSGHPLGPELWSVVVEDARLSNDFIAPSVILVILGVLLWWRGSTLSLGGTDPSSLLQRFIWGTGILLALVGLEGSSLDGGMVGANLVIYLAAGFIALSSSRLDAAAAGHASPGMRRWLVTMAILLLVVGFGWTALSLSWLGDPVRGIWNWVAGILIPVISQVLAWLYHLLGLDQPPAPLPMDPQPPVPGGGGEAGLFAMPEEVRDVWRLFFNLSWILMVLYAIFSTIRRWVTGRRDRTDRGASRERLPWSVRLGIRQALFVLLHGLASRWPGLLRAIGWGKASERSGTVRTLYRWLLAWSASRGVRRKPWMTPRELQTVLAAGWPHLATDFALLTDGYLLARYGEVSLPDADLEAALASWNRISGDRTRGREKGEGRRVKSERRERERGSE